MWLGEWWEEGKYGEGDNDCTGGNDAAQTLALSEAWLKEFSIHAALETYANYPMTVRNFRREGL